MKSIKIFHNCSDEPHSQHYYMIFKYFYVYLKKRSIFLGKTSGIIGKAKMLSPKTVELHYIKIVHIGLHSLEFSHILPNKL